MQNATLFTYYKCATNEVLQEMPKECVFSLLKWETMGQCVSECTSYDKRRWLKESIDNSFVFCDLKSKLLSFYIMLTSIKAISAIFPFTELWLQLRYLTLCISLQHSNGKLHKFLKGKKFSFIWIFSFYSFVQNFRNRRFLSWRGSNTQLWNTRNQ